VPLIDLALHIVGGSEAVLEQARRFLEIRWLSAPASLANLVLLGWLLGVQYARAPVILLVVGNLLNIVLDVWLVMGLHMNVQGAALATAIAEYGTFIIGLWMVWRVLAMRGISWRCSKPHGAAISVSCWRLTVTSCCARCFFSSASAR
jgi:MATE family multidrug resistance protein